MTLQYGNDSEIQIQTPTNADKSSNMFLIEVKSSKMTAQVLNNDAGPAQHIETVTDVSL
jgi:hypothetical protein